VIAVLIGTTGIAIWAIYKYIPNLLERTRQNTLNAVRQWFPLGPDGSFSYDLDINLSPRRCRLTDIEIKGGVGKVLNNIEFQDYDLEITSIELDSYSLLRNGAVNVTGLEGFQFDGEMPLAALSTFYTPEKSGIRNAEWEYDDFTEKVILKVDIVELDIGRVTIIGKLGIIDDGGLDLTERKYRNIHGPMAPDVIDFVEQHTELSLHFSIFDFPLNVKGFSFKDDDLHLELERE
jgi:hypothetical protein